MSKTMSTYNRRSARILKHWLETRAPRYTLATWSPGDGVTRYRIMRAGETYFGPGEPVCGTALGAKAAEDMIAAFVGGRRPVRFADGWTIIDIGGIPDRVKS